MKDIREDSTEKSQVNNLLLSDIIIHLLETTFVANIISKELELKFLNFVFLYFSFSKIKT